MVERLDGAYIHDDDWAAVEPECVSVVPIEGEEGGRGAPGWTERATQKFAEN